MVRKLKFHEKKLLRKVDLVGFKSESNIRVVEILRRYHIQKREDYTKYNKLSGLGLHACLVGRLFDDSAFSSPNRVEDCRP
jgi:hypothetical protein